MTGSKDRKDVEARRAATVLVLRENDGIEVLMVQRSDRGMFANALVFPGGMLESHDHSDEWIPHLTGIDGLLKSEQALRIAAIREVWEETGILLIGGDDEFISPPKQPESEEFLKQIRSRNLKLNLSDIQLFSNWVTPVGPPKRYDTFFYIARFDGNYEAFCDGIETVKLEWVKPQDLLARHNREDIDLLLATMGNLELLAKSSTISEAFEAASKRNISIVTPEMKTLDGIDIVTVPAGTEFGNLAIPTKRIFRRRTSR